MFMIDESTGRGYRLVERSAWMVRAVLLLAVLAHACSRSEASNRVPPVEGTSPGVSLAAASAAPAAVAAVVEPERSAARLPSGITLRYTEQGRANRPAVVLIHGYSDSWFSWSRILPLLPSAVHVIVPDLRGHGDSDRPRSGYGMRQLALDVLELMDVKGIERATVVGHSLGGLVAQQVALAAPERVERLVLVSTGASIHDIAVLADLRSAIDGLTDPVPQDFIREFQESTVFAPVPPEFMDRIVAESSKLPARVWHELLKGMLDMPRTTDLRTIQAPALIVWGENDAIFTRAQQDELVTLTRGTLRVYAATGHAPHWERPDEFARDLLGFLQSQAN